MSSVWRIYMNKVMLSQADVINNYLANDESLAAREFMTDNFMPFDQQDRVLNAIDRLAKPNSKKIGLIIELSGVNPANEMLLK